MNFSCRTQETFHGNGEFKWPSWFFGGEVVVGLIESRVKRKIAEVGQAFELMGKKLKPAGS